MPKLIVNPTSTARREIKLARTLLSIGRDPSNDLVLPDAMVSRRHAVIECRGNQYYLRDCNSSNGSVVNGDRISERSLRDGDLVAIGTARLLFREEVEIEDPGAKIVQHPSAPRLHCPSCKAGYRKGDLFCRECGAALQIPAGPRKAVCASCGTAVVLPAKFCNACGARLPLDEVSTPSLVTEPADPPRVDSPEPDKKEERPDEVASAAGESAPQPTLDPPPVPREEPRPRAEAPLRPREEAPAGPRKPPARVVSPAPPPLPPSSRPWRPAAVGSRPSIKAPVGAGPRLVAALIDGLVVALLGAVFVVPVAILWTPGTSGAESAGVLPIVVSVALSVALLLVGAAYHVAFWAARGATPGKRLLGLAVVGDDGSDLGWARALARVVGYALSAAALGIGFLMIAFGGIGLHDRIAGTRVVRRGE